MQILIPYFLLLVLISLNGLYAGRPIQQDPRSPKGYDDKKDFAIDIPDDSPAAAAKNAEPSQKSQSVPPVVHHPRKSSKPKRTHQKKPSVKKNESSGSEHVPLFRKHVSTTSPPSTTPSIFDQWVDSIERGNDAGRKVRQQGNPPPALVTFNHQYVTQWFQGTVAPTLKSQYGGCWLGLGLESNPTCLAGEYCVDQESGLPITTCSTPGVACTCPAASPCDAPPCAPQPQTCGKGCQPALNCPLPPSDGICIDSTFATNEYLDLSSSTVAIPGPMAYYAGTLQRNETCLAYGDAIDKFLRGTEEFSEKVRKVRTNIAANQFGSEICNWAQAHLECLPDEPRGTTTPSSAPPQQTDIDNYRRPKGTCKCMVALGDKPVIIPNEDKVEICYIPANRGYHSDCDREIFLPYGGIDGVRQNGRPLVKMTFEPAASFCVPNAECRAGYKYTGLRCQCKKKTKWDPLTSTCSRGDRRVSPGKMVQAQLLLLALSSSHLALQSIQQQP